MWGPSRVSHWPHPLHTLHAPPWPDHQLLWSLISLLSITSEILPNSDPLTLLSWCRKAHSCLCLLQAGLLQCTTDWNPQQEHSKYVQNSAVRILMRVRKYEHVTPILHSLHWLPISASIDYNVSLLTHQCIHGKAPSYLKELLTPQTSPRPLCSTNSHRLHPPRTKFRTLGDRAFCSATPRLWNSLPEYLRAPQTVLLAVFSH